MSEPTMNWPVFFSEMKKMAECMHDVGQSMEAAKGAGEEIEDWRLVSISAVEGITSAIADAGMVALGESRPWSEVDEMVAKGEVPTEEEVNEAIKSLMDLFVPPEFPKAKPN